MMEEIIFYTFLTLIMMMKLREQVDCRKSMGDIHFLHAQNHL